MWHFYGKHSAFSFFTPHKLNIQQKVIVYAKHSLFNYLCLRYYFQNCRLNVYFVMWNFCWSGLCSLFWKSFPVRDPLAVENARFYGIAWFWRHIGWHSLGTAQTFESVSVWMEEFYDLAIHKRLFNALKTQFPPKIEFYSNKLHDKLNFNTFRFIYQIRIRMMTYFKTFQIYFSL